MMGAQVGSALLWLAAAGTIASIASLILGDRLGEKEGESATNFGYIATLVVAALYSLGIILLTVAFLSDNVTYLYVAENHPNVVGTWAWLYRLSGVWAGPEGSFFFWAWLISVFNGWVAYKRMAVTDRLTSIALAVSNSVLFAFNFLLLTPKTDPFKVAVIQGTTAIHEATGVAFDFTDQFMSPLLQTWAMVIHPPTLFIGYAGLTIPFAYAVAALIVNDPSKRWIELCDRITVFSWLMLGIGIGLGAVWAYYELAFGGYWAWDPVENASLLPWLTGVGLLHSFTVYRRRGSFKGWSIMLAGVTFALVILGTFITRSGALAEGASVHVFGGDPYMFYILGLLVIAAVAVPGALFAMRRESFYSEVGFEGLLAKEYSYELNNVIMLSASLLVAYMTLTSAIPEGLPLPAAGQVIGRETYDLLARPLGVLYVLLMTVCPILSWKDTEGKVLWDRVRWPLVGGAVLYAGLLVLYVNKFLPVWRADAAKTVPFWQAGPLAVFGLAVAALAIVLPLWLFFDGARKKSAATGSSFGSSLLSLFTKARTTSGGYLTHFGIGLILLGLIGSTMFVEIAPQNFTTPGAEKIAIGDYEFTLKGTREITARNGDLQLFADLNMKKDGVAAGTVSPGQILPKQYVEDTGGDTNQGRKHAYIMRGFGQDVFITLQSVQEGLVAVDVKIFPLISFVWVGFGITIIGTGIASWPRKSRAEADAAAAKPKAPSGKKRRT